MQTLILTSSGKFITENNINQYLPKKITDCKIAYITTAAKKVFDTSYMEAHKKRMDELNFNYTEIDIADMKEKELKNKLTGYNIILVEGGNSYYLLKSVRESGFGKIIKKLLNQGVIYIGSSAGSYIAGTSIITATWTERGFDRCGVKNLEAMSLVPFVIKAHYTENMKNIIKEKRKELSHPLKILNDNQALLVKDNKIQLLGDQKEIII